MADFRGESQCLPIINWDAFELWGNAQDFNENSGSGNSDQLATRPVSLLRGGSGNWGGAGPGHPCQGVLKLVIFSGLWDNYSGCLTMRILSYQLANCSSKPLRASTFQGPLSRNPWKQEGKQDGKCLAWQGAS